MTPRKTSGEKKSTPRKKTAEDDVNTTLRLEQPMYQRLRKLAFDRDKDMREFVIEGIEIVLKREKY